MFEYLKPYIGQHASPNDFYPVSNCQMLWMTAGSGGVGLLHPIGKPYPGDHLG
jgi:hypothetical protein